MLENQTVHRRIARPGRPPLSIQRPPRHRFRIRYFVLAIFLALAPYHYAPSVFATEDITCVDIEFIFARGSGEDLGSDTYRAWENSLTSELANEISDKKLTYNFYELGTKPQNGSRYPAVRIAGDLEGIINLGGAAISAGESYAFGASVASGIAELKAYVGRVMSACPKTKFVLGGYSQGAMVLTRTLPSLDATRIVYAATFGDPKLYLPEGARPQQDEFYVPEACYGKNLSEYRAYVPDCYAYAGILGAAIPYQPLGYSKKLGTWCNQDDIMCSSGMSIRDHTSYVADQLYPDAARNIVRAIKSAFVDRLDYDFAVDQHIHEVAIVADISGSMARGDLYWSLTREAENLAKKVLDSGGRVSFFTYRDLIDGTITERLCDFTCTLDEFKEAVNSVTLILGEDDDESALSAMNYAINAVNWSENSEKSLLVLTDAGLHEPDRDGTTSADVVASSKAHGGVKIFAPVWKEYLDEYRVVTERTGGEVLNLAKGIEKATAAILPSPVINLAETSYTGPIGSHFVFDASASQVFAGPDLTYDWDLDGNGLYELQGVGPIAEKTYDRFEGDVFVRATDRAGHRTIASIHVKTEGVLTAPSRAKISSADFQVTTNADLVTYADSEPDTDSTAKVAVNINFDTDAEHVLLIVDETVLGFVEVAHGQGNLTVENLEPSSRLALVPYSNAGRRGESYTISLNKNPDGPSPSNPTPNVPAAPTLTPIAPSGTTTSSPLATVPKAPNTGVRSLSREEVSMP